MLRPETMLRLDQRTTITFPAIAAEQPSWLDLLDGAVHFISRHPGGLQIKTPFVNAAIEGTEFVLRVEPEQTELWVFEGRVLASNDAGSLAVNSGEAAVARAGQPPMRRIDVRPRDAVQWALYYPPLIDFRAAVHEAGPAAQTIREALERYRKGDLPGAMARLEALPAASRDAPYFALKAGLLLSVGRLDAAQADISQALSLDPDNATALALQSVIALAQNENEKALGLAKKAVEREPRSPVPRIALSYAQQANFQIGAALKTVEDAVKLDPDDALVWARLAELRLSTGELDQALEAARQAVARNPDLARTQTVLGFAHLTRMEIAAAKSAFEKAIALDQADPLPRLGLGLAKIRAGALEAGRQDIEVATSLDPNNSLIRSYMGKAYFEERQDALAGSQLAMAKELDPKDPTAWFYDAIRRQLDNRPVEALHDMERSIELNDNRGVYRSRLLLDEDAAARSVNLGQIYNDLGFDGLAAAETVKSIVADPVNFSSHRLLADSYTSIPHLETARASEVLQAQLRQPLTLVWPLQLAESKLIIPSLSGFPAVSAAGPTRVGFTPVFSRNGLHLQAEGMAGSADTLGDQVILAGLLDRVSFSFAQYHFETDGLVDQKDQRKEAYNAFVFGQLTHGTTLQAEYAKSQTNRRDILTDFDPLFALPIRTDQSTETFRVGLRHEFGPRADVVASMMSEKVKSLDDFGSGNAFTAENSTLEIQSSLVWQGASFVLGAGYLHGNQDFGPTGAPQTSASQYQKNAYAYSYVPLLGKRLTAVLGVSADFPDEEDIPDRHALSPKLGLVFRPSPDTLLRVAYFRTLSRRLVSSQTLEPTQVAGFNQLYEDFAGTVAKRYGLGLDHKLGARVYTGVEATARHLTIPVFSGGPPEDVEWEEHLGRAYVNWMPTKRLSATAEYRWEQYKRPEAFTGLEAFRDVTIQRVPLTLGWFLPSGLRFSLTQTYIRQDASLLVAIGAPEVTIDEGFWVTDLSLRYRLPRRRGFVGLEVRNLFDHESRFQDTDPLNPTVAQRQLLMGRIQLVF
jgi:tetratricopeptide (TPR) repeat protein